MSSAVTCPSYIIVGAGIFGASTAYHLAKAVPSAKITLIDRSSYPCPLAASYDYQKIVRADYGDKFYMSLALKAQHEWCTKPLYSQYYHENGMINMEGTGLGRRMVQNFKDLGVESKAEVIDSDELKRRYPLFWDADYSETTDCYVNPEAGWAEAATSLKAVIVEAINDGVEYVEGNVSKLLTDTEGDCLGVALSDGRKLEAGKVVLATGSNTSKILADSAPHRPEMQAGERIIGAAVVTGVVKLTREQVELYKDMPVFLHRLGGIDGTSDKEPPIDLIFERPLLDDSYLVTGETYPPTPENVMKFCRSISFSNSYCHEASDQIISSPPPAQFDEGQRDVSESLKKEIQIVMKGCWGRQIEGMEIDSYRICWYDPPWYSSIHCTIIASLICLYTRCCSSASLTNDNLDRATPAIGILSRPTKTSSFRPILIVTVFILPQVALSMDGNFSQSSESTLSTSCTVSLSLALRSDGHGIVPRKVVRKNS